MQLRQLAAIKARQHDRAARMARRRGDQPVDQTRGLDLVAPAERLDDALHVAATLAGVLDEVEILVGSDLLDADEHGAAPCSWQSTTILCVTTSKIATLYCNRPDGLAPHHGATCRTPNNSADLSNHFPQNRGSWVKELQKELGETLHYNAAIDILPVVVTCIGYRIIGDEKYHHTPRILHACPVDTQEHQIW